MVRVHVGPQYLILNCFNIKQLRIFLCQLFSFRTIFRTNLLTLTIWEGLVQYTIF